MNDTLDTSQDTLKVHVHRLQCIYDLLHTLKAYGHSPSCIPSHALRIRAGQMIYYIKSVWSLSQQAFIYRSAHYSPSAICTYWYDFRLDCSLHDLQHAIHTYKMYQLMGSVNNLMYTFYIYHIKCVQPDDDLLIQSKQSFSIKHLLSCVDCYYVVINLEHNRMCNLKKHYSLA